MSGWFAVKRGITRHELFHGRADRLMVWIWLLDNVAWKETKNDVNGQTITIPRGSVCASERRIANECGIGRQPVRTFLDRLEADQMITRELTHGRSIISLCNWEKYQSVENTTNPRRNPRATQEQPTKGTREQDITLEPNGSNGADAPQTIEVSVVSAAAWNAGKPFLQSRGVSNPGAMIGRWLKDHSPLEVLAALAAAQQSGTQDPIPYITEALKDKPNGKSTGPSSTLLSGFLRATEGRLAGGADSDLA